MTIAAARVLIGALTLTVLSQLFPPKPRAAGDEAVKPAIPVPVLYVLIALLEGVLPFFLIAWGQQHVDSGVTAVLVGSVPILTLVLSVIMTRASFGPFATLSVLLGFPGILLLVGPGTGAGNGALMYEGAIFLGCVSFAISLNLLGQLPHGDPIGSAKKILWISSIPLLIAALVMDQPWRLNWHGQGVLALVLLGTVGSGLAYILYATLAQRRGPVFTSLSNFLVPLVGVLLGVAVRHEQFGSRQALALLLIVAALAANESKALFSAVGKRLAR